MSAKKAGFTLVELLVVIAIIGILVALLLPAVQSAREASRRTMCSNRFRQACLGLHNYHSVHKSFPEGMTFYTDEMAKTPSCSPPMPGKNGFWEGYGWGMLILPYMEEGGLYDRFDMKKSFEPWLSLPNFRLAATRLDAFLCPTDPHAGHLVFHTNSGQNGTNRDEDLADSNMAGVADSAEWTCDGLWPKGLRVADGVMAERTGCKTSNITDGTSKTLILSEVTGDVRDKYNGFAWICFNLVDTQDGINGPTSLPGGAGNTGFPISRRLMGPSSWHPGGCHMVFADGSVQFMSENISSLTMKALTTRAGGDITDGGGT